MDKESNWGRKIVVRVILFLHLRENMFGFQIMNNSENAKYTKGPWAVNKSIFSTFCLQENHIGTPSRTVAVIYDDTSADEQAREEVAANIKLINAAPDLLAACELSLQGIDLVLERCKNGQGNSDFVGYAMLRDVLFAAINKAK